MNHTEQITNQTILIRLYEQSQILCILKHVGDVGDRSSTPKGCNAIYVRDIRDSNNLQSF